jgi:hypothetical protein
MLQLLSHLESLVEAIVTEKFPDLVHSSVEHIKWERTSKELKQLIHWDDMWCSYHKLGKILNPNQSKGLSKMDVPDRLARPFRNSDEPETWNGPSPPVISLLLFTDYDLISSTSSERIRNTNMI